MGANFECYKSDFDTKDEVISEFNVICNQARHDYGHAGYTGTFAEAPGIDFPRGRQKTTEKEAKEWLVEHAEKWEDALAVPLIGGGYLVGGWFSS